MKQTKQPIYDLNFYSWIIFMVLIVFVAGFGAFEKYYLMFATYGLILTEFYIYGRLKKKELEAI